MSHLQDKTVVVTGAAGGFGRLVSEKVASLGANVICGDIDEQGVAEVVEHIQSRGGQAHGVAVDVTDLAQVKRLVDAGIERFDGVDVMLNNAGIMPLGFYADHAQAIDAWHRCIDINIKGVLNGIVAAYDSMIAQGRGHVVNVSSIYGNYPVVGAAVYGASKAAVNFLSESLRVESQGKIKVTTIKPTGVPQTGLSAGVINQQAVVGILGQNAPAYLQQMQAHLAGELPAEQTDPQNIEYYALAPEHLADQIVYAMDQPWGVSIGEMTVRASGDGYIL